MFIWNLYILKLLMKNDLLCFWYYTSFKIIFCSAAWWWIFYFSSHLWTAMNTSFLRFVWIRHIFTWNCHLSPDLNYEQLMNTTSFIHGQQLTLFSFMFCIDPTKISAYCNISSIWLLKQIHWRVFHFIL